MPNYYYIGTMLPDLHIGQPAEMSLQEFLLLLQENLSPADYAKVQVIANYYDISNLRAYWKGAALDPMGNLNSQEMEEALATRSMLPAYVFSYLDMHASTSERLQHFPQLLSWFFNEEIKQSSGMLRDYFSQERDLRLILLAFRAKKLGREVTNELQYENPQEELVAQILAQKDAPEYIPPEKYEELAPLFKKYYDQPVELQKSLLAYRFERLEQELGLDLFSMDRILIYFIKLIVVERWQHLNKQKGLEIVDKMMKANP